MASILIVDDQEGMRQSLALRLRMEGFDVHAVGDGVEAVARAGALRPDVVITDMRMEPLSGIEVLRQVRQCSPTTAVIMMTAFATIENAVTAMKLGAFDYIMKPFKDEVLLNMIGRALKIDRLHDKPDQVSSAHRGAAPRLIGEGARMREVMAMVGRLAPTTLSVLITGETGTGKNLVAKLLHRGSSRNARAFVGVNCAALPDTLFESEVFGHEKGAFTGAVGAHRGLFEEADGGTLFLDEVGLLSLSSQAKLLSAIEDRQIRRVGSSRPLAVDVRFVGATNADLAERVRRGEFRQDLFFRLNTAMIHLPALRDRREDIPALIDHFLAIAAVKDGEAVAFSAEAMERMLDYDYPGNVRELENAVHWALAVRRSSIVDVVDLPEMFRRRSERRVPELPAGRSDGGNSLDEVERRHILDCIDRHQGNLSQAARALGIGRTTLWRKMKEYGIAEAR